MSGPICERCGQDSVLYKQPERIADLERQLAEIDDALAKSGQPVPYDGKSGRCLPDRVFWLAASRDMRKRQLAETQAERESLIRWGRAIWHRFMWEAGHAEVQRDEAQGKLEEMAGLYIKHDARSHYKDDRVCAACCRDRILRGIKEGRPTA